ncbi:MAG: nucleotidyltransferase domain-containing protein [Leptospiraceae bacterium]|nr:nucleotidyltransferase domain-containing protein [Leptospiraceae bacterium]
MSIIESIQITNDPFIKGIVEQIVKSAQPISIYLFGSTSRGDNKANSNLDFLVLIPENQHRRKTAQKLYQEVESKSVPCDFVVATPSILEKNLENSYKIYSNAIKDGILLYGK